MKFLTVITLTLLISSFAFAQMNVDIREAGTTMSQGYQNAFVVEIPGTTAAMAEDVWKGFIKKYDGKTKRDRKSDEWFTDNAEIKGLSSGTVDVYARFNEADSMAMATIWMDLGGSWLSSDTHSDRMIVANQFMNTYALAVGKEQAKQNLKMEEKELKAREREMEALQDAKKDYEREIARAKELIAKMEANIEENAKDQEAKAKEVEMQKMDVMRAEARMNEF